MINACYKQIKIQDKQKEKMLYFQLTIDKSYEFIKKFKINKHLLEK